MNENPDFSKRTHFPGENGNPFDVILHTFESSDKLPEAIFFIVLLLFAWLGGQGIWWLSLIFLSIFCVDWGLLTFLPRFNLSYGPVKPNVVLLAALRTLFGVMPLPVWASIGIQGIGTLLVVYGFYLEPQNIKVSYQKLKPAGFSPSRPLRLLHMGDLHIEKITRREILLNNLIHSLKPDIILFSGDVLNLSFVRNADSIRAARQIIEDWRAPLGTYFVSGSPAVDLPDVLPDLLKGLPLRYLNNEQVSLSFEGACLQIFGISCTHRPHLDNNILDSLVSQSPQESFRILLYHSPDLAPEAAKADISLMLSGHTHGGQVRLPIIGALFTASLYGKRFEAGRYQLDHTTLYITRGIGMEGAGAPRVRFLCPPEITLWEIG